MAKAIRMVQVVKYYPKKIVICSRCHREIFCQPFIYRMTLLTKRKAKTEHICWKCIRDSEGCFLIESNYPEHFYQVAARGGFALKLKRPLSLFVDVPHGELHENL